MPSSVKVGWPVICLALWLTSASEAQAQKVIVVHSGTEILPYKSLSDESQRLAREIPALQGKEWRIGFKCARGGVLGFDFWTMDGEFVLYSADGHLPLTAELAQALAIPTADLRFPLLYHVPSGWWLLGFCLIIFAVAYWRVSKYRHLRRLHADARYRDALNLVEEALFQPTEQGQNGDEAALAASRLNQIAEAREKAVQLLKARDIPEPVARKNLALLLRDIATRLPR